MREETIQKFENFCWHDTVIENIQLIKRGEERENKFDTIFSYSSSTPSSEKDLFEPYSYKDIKGQLKFNDCIFINLDVNLSLQSFFSFEICEAKITYDPELIDTILAENCLPGNYQIFNKEPKDFLEFNQFIKQEYPDKEEYLKVHILLTSGGEIILVIKSFELLEVS